MSEPVLGCCPECGRPQLDTWHSVGLGEVKDYYLHRESTERRLLFSGHVTTLRHIPDYACSVVIFGPGGMQLVSEVRYRSAVDVAMSTVEEMMDAYAGWFGLYGHPIEATEETEGAQA